MQKYVVKGFFVLLVLMVFGVYVDDNLFWYGFIV